MFTNQKENTIISQKTLIPLSKGQPKKIVKEFCESTSLHGYSYLYIADTISVKLIWVFVIIVMTGIGTAFIAINTDAYIKARLVNNIESSTSNLRVCIIVLCNPRTIKGGPLNSLI